MKNMIGWEEGFDGKASRFSREVNQGEYTVLYPGKTRLKPRLFLPAISCGYFSEKLKPRLIFGTAGTHRRLNPGT